MNFLAIRAAYLDEQLTDEEAQIKLGLRGWTSLSADAIVRAWAVIRYLSKRLDALRDKAFTPRLDRPSIVGLIDFAYCEKHVSRHRASEYLTSDGMLPDVAEHHLDCLDRIVHHDQQRNEYLDDPDNAMRYCTRCGRKCSDLNLSNRAICYDCSAAAEREAQTNLKERKGAYYRKWRQAMIQTSYRLADEHLAEVRAEKHPDWTCSCGVANPATHTQCLQCGAYSHDAITS